MRSARVAATCRRYVAVAWMSPSGESAAAAALAAAARALEADLDPPGDVHGSPALRRHLARVLLARVLRGLGEPRP